MLDRFQQNEIADLLGVTERAIQFWIADEHPKVPFVKTQRKIDELYTNLIIEGKTTEELRGLPGREDQTFLEKRKKAKINPTAYMVPFIPVKAQAGYVRAVDQQIYMDTLEKYALPPGVNPHGNVWAYWEVEGDSMLPQFREGDIILTSLVHQMDWDNIRNFYTYVIITHDQASEKFRQRVLFKRLFCKNALEWVLISDNEEMYPQQLIPVEDIKEVWVYRKTWSTRGIVLSKGK